MTSSDATTAILVRAISAPPVTMGSLAPLLGLDVAMIGPIIGRLVQDRALVVACGDGGDVAFSPGDPAAVLAVAPEDPVVADWARMRSACLDKELRPLRSGAELTALMTGFGGRARMVTCLLPHGLGERGRRVRGMYREIARDAVSQHATVRLLVPLGLQDIEPGQQFCDELRSHGVEVRFSQRIETPQIVWHDVGALLLRSEGLFVDSPGSSVYAAACFDAGHDADEATRLAVVRMLSEGHTDAVAARLLGLSERQFRRRVSQLMQELGAESRFQAGVLASRNLRW